MQILFSPTKADAADTLVQPVLKDADALPAGLPAWLPQAAAAARFTGDVAAVLESFVERDGRTVRLLIVGVGAGQPAEMERAGAAVTARLQTSGARHAAVMFDGVGAGAQAILHFGLGAKLRNWRKDNYRTRLPEKARPTLDKLTLVSGEPGLESGWAALSALAEGVAFARDLIAEPANILYPESFVQRCAPLAEMGVELTVLDENDMAKLGMGALLGVAQGSVRKPRLLAMRWDGTEGAEKAPVAFVGKGVTFDTGGISIKPAAGMEDMKWDMGGAAAVAGAMKALAGRKAKAHVVGVCGLVENMPDGNAQRPGDVVTSMSGQTIEVINTDAEGRLVLCDALTWVQEKFAPRAIVDLATLTGAMIVSLGHEYGGLFASQDALADQLTAAGETVGEKLWRFPLSDAYNKMIDSPIADMKNVGPRFAGSITAAQFLKRFVQDDTPWAHLDIAGMVWADKPGATWDKGATGYGVRLLDRFIADNFEKQGRA